MPFTVSWQGSKGTQRSEDKGTTEDRKEKVEQEKNVKGENAAGEWKGKKKRDGKA